MTIFVRIECGYASIEDAAAQIVDAARKLKVPVICSFRGIDVVARPDADTTESYVVSQYLDEIKFRQDSQTQRTG